MDQATRFTPLIAVVAFLTACTSSIAAPDSPAAVMLGEWHYAASNTVSDPPLLNTGLRVSVMVDSAEGMRFWGRVTLWFAGDVGIAPGAFGRVAGSLDDSNRVSLEIPREAIQGTTVRVRGELAGDVLTIRDCHSGAEAGPFENGSAFERITTR